MKGDENRAQMQLSRTSFDAPTGGRVADRVNGQSGVFDRAGGLSSPPAARIGCHTRDIRSNLI